MHPAFEDADRNAAAFQDVLRRGPHAMTAVSGRYTVLIHPSTTKGGWWQATFFDADMDPWGDSVAPTWERLLDHIRYEVDWTRAKARAARPNQGHLPGVEQIAIEGSGELEDYFPKTGAGELSEEQGDLYYGRNIIWIGDEGRMMRAYPDYTQHIWGNIFDPDKLAAVVSGVDEAKDRLMFFAPYGTVGRIGLQEVKESHDYFADEGLDRPYTTDNEELDRFLVDPDDVLDDYGEPGDDERTEREADIRQELADAVANDDGDLGAWVVTIRDGNHRAFGALLSGEPYVYVMVSDNQMQDLEEAQKKGTLTDEQAELLEMLD